MTHIAYGVSPKLCRSEAITERANIAIDFENLRHRLGHLRDTLEM
jgi:hypothetical protein